MDDTLFPTYEEIATALLSFIYSKGGAAQPSETYVPLANFFDLSHKARSITRGEYFGRDRHPQSAWHCLIQWGRRDLVKAGLIDQQAPRGVWKLTEEGKEEARKIAAVNRRLNFQPITNSNTNNPITPIHIQVPKTPLASDLHKPNESRGIKYRVYRVLRDTNLASKIKMLHQYKCQICGEALQLNEDQFYAEAHHIIPVGTPHDGPDIGENILCVCPNHHALLDYGAIRLDKSQFRSHPKHNIRSEYINYHNNEIFGKIE